MASKQNFASSSPRVKWHGVLFTCANPTMHTIQLGCHEHGGFMNMGCLLSNVGLTGATLTQRQCGSEQAMNNNVWVAADGGCEVGILRHCQRIVAPLTRILDLAGAKVTRQLNTAQQAYR